MKIILETDAIKWPLTGIGRYTWELASRLPAKENLTEVKYFSRGCKQTLESLHLIGTTKSKPLFFLSPRRLIFNRYMTWPYRIITRMTEVRINKLKDHLYHGPNFLIPKLDIPTVLTVHDLSTYKDPGWHPTERIKKINSLLPSSINNANVVLTVSEAIRTEVIAHFKISPEKVIAVSNGVDTDSFAPRTEAEIAATLAQYGLTYKAYTLCVSTIEPRKNILRLIKAYKNLPSALSKRWPLVIIGGSGWNNENIMEEIKAAQNAGWLKYFGFISQQDLPQVYAGCRLFVYPSLYEGFGLPIVEAMASGAPVLTSNCSSMPEVANGAARLINPLDIDDLQQNLLSCLDDNAWLQQARQLGLVQATTFSWDDCVEKTVKAYRLAMNAA